MTDWFEIYDGHKIGRDPRKMTMDELRDIGHEPMSPGRALRLRCIDCSHTADEVRKCVAVKCPSWPFRMGKNPWREKRVMSDEQREAARERLAKARGVATWDGDDDTDDE